MKQVGDRITTKIHVASIDLLLEINHTLYKPFVKHDSKGNKIHYVSMLKAMYNVMKSSMLF
jgi:hypothetical protein